MALILAADIGGTNSRFAVFEARSGVLSMGPSVWLPSHGAADFGELLAQVAEAGLPLAASEADMIGLAVAGAVEGRVFCDPPNIPWTVDLSRPESFFGHDRFVLLNDFAAQAFAVRTPIMNEALDILPGHAEEGGVVAVIGAGTGLGKAALVPDGRGGWLALPTEGGHSLFAFQGPEEFEFQRFLCARSGREQVIGDMVVTGSGLSALCAFLTGRELDPAGVTAAFGEHPKVLDWAARFYGRACRNLALDILALGGVVISGGVAAKAMELVTHESFTREFRTSETHADLLARIPVQLNRREDSGLWGAAFAAVQCLAGGCH